jgi:autotransporter translocation and assembly factor TamB
LSVATGSTQVADLSVTSPFHVDPYLISMDGLKVSALGGSLAAKVFLEKLKDLSIEGQLRNFSLPVLTSASTGKQLGYDGSLEGSILAKGDLKAKGTTGYAADARLNIVAGHHGIPVSGRLYANYIGSEGTVNIDRSSVVLPNSRLDLDGSLNSRIDLNLTSSNLGDFLPAVNFGSSKPLSSLPVVLQGGTAQIIAQMTGNMSAPVLGAHLGITRFAVGGRPFDNLELDAAASPSGASIQNGVLEAKGLNTHFDGSLGLKKWELLPSSPLSANLTLTNGNLANLVSLAGSSSVQASGAAAASVYLRGTYGDPLGNAHVQVSDGSFNQQQFSNFLMNVDLADQLITLSQLEFDTAGGKIASSGTFRHPRDSFMTGHAQLALSATGLQLAQVEALAKQNGGVAGLVQLAANVSGDIESRNKRTRFAVSNVTLDLSARNLEVHNQTAGDLTATARTSNGQVKYKLDSDFAGSTIRADGSTSLTGDYLTKAEATIQDLSVAKALQMAGQAAIPASGDFSAKAQVNGNLKDPSANLSFSLSRADVYHEPVQRLNGSVSYENNLVNIPFIELKVPAGDLKLSGSFHHPVSDLRSGTLALAVTSSDIDLSKINHVQQERPDLRGTLRLAADLSASVRQQHGRQQVLFSKLNANASTGNLRIAGKAIGGMRFAAQTRGSDLNFRLDSDIAQSEIHGEGQMQLTGDYPIHSKLSFGSIKLSNLAPLLSRNSTAPLPVEVLLNGEAGVDGPTLDPDNLRARVQLNQLDLRTQNAGSTGSIAIRKVELQNRNPIVVTLNHEVVQIEQLDIEGHGTSIVASGSMNLKNVTSPLALTLKGGVDLGILQDADRDFYSSGSLALQAVIRGSFASPRANGRVDLKDANINYSGAPNGLSNANGTILLNGTSLSIQSLTAESGGGKIALSGFATLGAGVPSANLKAVASKVRVRYGGISATSDATISLTGNVKRSLLAGTISIQRIIYEGSTDTGSLLSAAATPPSTPSSPSPLLSGMRLDLHILTAPDIQVSSTYANRFSVLANLTMRGTAEEPGMLGRVNVTDGQLVFFGNTYTVTTGTINFYDPNSITPVLNVSLETIAQGVNVTIGVTGPMDNLKLNYRSDPPLTFEQIVQLLATNTTPTNPVIAARQPEPPQQSMTQMGESALLGQAVANPLASRMQRVFGLSQLKIDPSLSQNYGPSARLTLQQKVTSNITFTYTDDVSQPNAQIVRVQWDLTDNLSAVALRDSNSNVSIEVFYKFTRK